MRFFNTTGPVKPARHYHIPPLDRVNLAELRRLVDEERYFVLHAPRQTGKTSVLLALQELLHGEGRYRCVYANVEAAQAMREDVRGATQAILTQMARQARQVGDRFLTETWSGVFAEYGPSALGEVLALWSEADERPLVLLIDEIDALVGDTLLSVLRQLRADYPHRPKSFPQSIVLCGVRDVRGSAFSKAESLRLGDFSRADVAALLGQHTAETGQAFADEAMEAVWVQTLGQPWLVNALAYEACFRGDDAPDHGRRIEEADVMNAKEALFLRRDPHLDQLADNLREERVRQVVEPLLAGADPLGLSERDLKYVRELGLVALDTPLRIANPIYAEAAPRELSRATGGCPP